MSKKAKKAFRLAYETLQFVKMYQSELSEPYSSHEDVDKALETIEKLMSKDDWEDLYEKGT